MSASVHSTRSMSIYRMLPTILILCAQLLNVACFSTRATADCTVLSTLNGTVYRLSKPSGKGCLTDWAADQRVVVDREGNRAKNVLDVNDEQLTLLTCYEEVTCWIDCPHVKDEQKKIVCNTDCKSYLVDPGPTPVNKAAATAEVGSSARPNKMVLVITSLYLVIYWALMY